MNKSTVVSKRLHVSGFLWNGGKARHEYPLHVIGRPDLEGVEPTCAEDAKRIAGDFESLDSARLVVITQQIVTKKRTKKLI